MEGKLLGEKESVLWGPTELKMVTVGLGEHRDEIRNDGGLPQGKVPLPG